MADPRPDPQQSSSSAIRRWLRLGPSRAELRAEAELWRGRCERSNRDRDEGYARLKQVRQEAHAEKEKVFRHLREARAWIQELQDTVHDQLNEPPPGASCIKVRFHRIEEAEEWAKSIAARTGEAPQAYNTYPCRDCPRSPVTVSRYFHVGHKGNAEAQAEKERAIKRELKRRVAASREGRLLGQQVDPRIMDKLRTLREQMDKTPGPDAAPGE